MKIQMDIRQLDRQRDGHTYDKREPIIAHDYHVARYNKAILFLLNYSTLMFTNFTRLTSMHIGTVYIFNSLKN